MIGRIARMNDNPPTDAANPYQQRILRVLLHIQRNLDRELSLDELAKVAHFSPFHFHRVFRGMVGESVMEYVRRLRLEQAALQLKHGRRQIVRIAFDAGYEAHESFTRAFRAMFGCSPSQYRRNRLGGLPDGAACSGSLPSGEPTPASFFLSPTLSGDVAMDVRIEQRTPTRVVFTRGTGPYAQAARVAWERLCAWADPLLGLIDADTQLIGICHDDPEVTPPDKVRYDAAVTIRHDVQTQGEIGIQEIPGL
jgi:AraC family transcriptional regulator